MYKPSEHHSYDIKLACQVGPDLAVLIQHFQFWIRLNRYKKKNIKHGKCWTYQTRKDIQAHFPYWKYHEVKYMCEKLVSKGILITANFNKSKMDKTLWYAFADEEAFGVDEESSKNLYEGENSPSKEKILHREEKILQPIPDTEKEDAEKEEQTNVRGCSQSSEPIGKVTLREYGIDEKKYALLRKQFSIDEISIAFEMLKRSKRPVTNSFGWMQKCITEGWAVKEMQSEEAKRNLLSENIDFSLHVEKTSYNKLKAGCSINLSKDGLIIISGEKIYEFDFFDIKFKEKVSSRLKGMGIDV